MPINCASMNMASEARMTEEYLGVISLIGRLHRQFLEIVKLELEGADIRDINNVQAVMLFNLGDAEMTVGELTLRGCYLGSNVSYNLKKMVENLYVEQARSQHDRRSVHVKLTPKGRALRDRLVAMHRRHAELLQCATPAPDLEHAAATMRRLERFWVRVGDEVRRIAA
jgi:DNA-binding MarR family transcriptional regulator